MFFVSKVSIDTGSVAFEEEVPKAVAKTFAMLPINRNGSVRVSKPVKRFVNEKTLK